MVNIWLTASSHSLVELIVLNVGFQAGILDTRTFSMFVLHALVLTFMTTPLTILFYPPKYRVHEGALPKPTDTSREEGSSAPRDLEDAVKTRFAVVVDRIEQLPAVMTLTQLLQSKSNSTVTPSDETASTADSSANEKAALAEAHGLPVLPHGRQAEAPRITVDALRLIELTNRTSAVFKSHEAENLAHSDPVLAILKTHGYLNRMNVSTSLAVVDYEDFSENVSRHTRTSGSQMVILPWTSGLASVEAVAAETPAANEASGASPFDALFQQKREGDHHAVAAHSHYIRRVFADTPVDVALFWDRGFPQAFESGARYHVFMPFFGGPDDRVALAFVVQLCRNASVSATVVRVRKSDEDALGQRDTIEEIKAQNQQTVHSVSSRAAYITVRMSVLTACSSHRRCSPTPCTAHRRPKPGSHRTRPTASSGRSSPRCPCRSSAPRSRA